VATRYIGSKARLISEIERFVEAPSRTDGFFVDLFCGTGVVAESAARQGWRIRLNDHLTCAVTLAAARISSEQEARFAAFGGYAAAIRRLNALAPASGFITAQYSPRSIEIAGIERRYFAETNAARIDAIRQRIRAWRSAGKLTRPEERLLIADLLLAANRVANIAGTYGCFMRGWLPQALKPLQLLRRPLLASRISKQIYSRDATNVPVSRNDLVYIDPPYTKRQYAAYYHLLETIAEGDQPTVAGKTGLRPWHDKASAYCYRTRARQALNSLISDLPARRVLLSYSSEGHVKLKDLREDLSAIGKVEVHALAELGRYRPNQAASAAGSAVSEYLITINRAVRR
jgi:adenine-specific DNA-methyltransferase